MFNLELAAVCRQGVIAQHIYWSVESRFRELEKQHRACCRNCGFFDNNPFLPCAVNPSMAANPDIKTDCKYFEKGDGK